MTLEYNATPESSGALDLGVGSHSVKDFAFITPEDSRTFFKAERTNLDTTGTQLDLGDVSKLYKTNDITDARSSTILSVPYVRDPRENDGIRIGEQTDEQTGPQETDGGPQDRDRMPFEVLTDDHSFGPVRHFPVNDVTLTFTQVKQNVDLMKFTSETSNTILTGDKVNDVSNSLQLKEAPKPPTTTADGKTEVVQPRGDKSQVDQKTGDRKTGDQPAIEEYQVKKGDNLSKIAREHLGPKATPQEIEKFIQETVKLNGWKDRTHVLQEHDRIKVPGDASKETKPDSQQKQEQRDQLTKLAEEKFRDDPARLEEFKKNMQRFEERAARDGLSDAEIAKTYKETSRLLEANGNKPLTPEQRSRLAEQVIRQAADPTVIDQGAHNTCNTATVEARMYTRNPSDAARLVADVALTGQYTTKDGTRVRVNPAPHDTSKDGSTIDGDRSHASEIFQVTAVNLHVEIENRKTVPRGQLRYEQHPVKPGSGDTGERIIDYSKKPPEVVDTAPNVTDENLGNLRDVYGSITGIYEKGIILGHDELIIDKSDGIKKIKSEQELNDALAEAKKNGKMPLIVAVDTNMEPFWTDSGAGTAGGSGGKHVVTVTDYEPGPPAKVTIDNQWGSSNDHDKTRPVTVHDLYGAMRSPEGAVQELEQDVQNARDTGKPDLYKESELARLKHATGQMTDEDYEKELSRISKDVQKMGEGPERDRAREKLNDAMHSLPPAAFFRVLREQRDIGLVSKEEYFQSIKDETMMMYDARKYLSSIGMYNSHFKDKYEDGVKELMKSLDGMTPEQVMEITNALKGK